MTHDSIFRRHVALPSDHGSWAFFLGPLAIGLFAGGRWHTTAIYLTVAATCGFLIRQPITLIVKVLAGRRPKDTLRAAWFWCGVYGSIALLHVTGLVVRGFGYILYLAVPGLLVFGWYLYLIFRRDERRQWFLEITATGVMALVAPAGMWIGLGYPSASGWLLWIMVWLQSAAGIAYAYLRLEQRQLKELSPMAKRWKLGGSALAISSLGLGLAVGLGLAGILPGGLFVAFAVQWGEVLWGVRNPAIGWKPTAIGYRQLVVSIAFTVLFILAWRF